MNPLGTRRKAIAPVAALHLWLWGWVLLAALAGGPRLMALDPQRSIHQYGHDRWNQQDGLPGSAVRGVYQLSDGYLWIHSGGSLFRFDGVRFVPITPALNGAPTGETIRAARLLPGGRLLLRSKTRTLHLEEGRFTEVIQPVALPDGMDMSICQTREGHIWIASDNQVYRSKGGGLERVIQGSSWTRDMIEDHEGSVWIASISGLYRCRRERLTKFPQGYQWSIGSCDLPMEPPTAGESAMKLPKEPGTLMEDRAGCLWIGTMQGLFKLERGVMKAAAEAAPLKACVISALLEDREGNVWAGTQGQGLYRIARGGCTRFTAADGLSDDNIVSLGEDREGSLWIGTRTGLDRLRDTPLVTLTTQEGLSNDNTSNVLEAKNGARYIATLGGGITRIQGGRISVFNTRNGLPKDSTGNFYEAKDGTVWAGMDHGLAEFRDGRVRTHTGGGRLASLYTSAICEDDRSLIIACSDLNLYRYQNDRLTPYDLRLETIPEPKGSASGQAQGPAPGPAGIRYVFAMHRDEEGTLWFAMTAGLYRLGPQDPPEKAVRTAFREPAQTLTDDGRGYLWITSRNVPGFTRLKKSDGSLVHYGPEGGVTADAIGRILTDASGNLWMASSEGIFCYARPDVDAFAQGAARRIQATRYGTIDGLKTEDCGVMGLEPSAWRGRDGKLYFTSRKGLVEVDPEHMLRNALPPPVRVESMAADGSVLGPEASLRFPAGKENFEIHYTALSLLVPSRVRFQYRLVGYDSGWVDAGTRRTAFYTHLPPGSYRFQVRACNNDGLWNEEGASLSFTLRPHFYQTLWFYALVSLAVSGAILGLFVFRVHQHQRAERLLQARITEAMAHIKTLHGLLPICAWCHKVRDDKGYWSQIEDYIATYTQAEFSHGICPDCRDKITHRTRED